MRTRTRRSQPGHPPTLASSRDVAQSGSAPALGAGGRRFKSAHPDQYLGFDLRLCGSVGFQTGGLKAASSHSGSQTVFSRINASAAPLIVDTTAGPMLGVGRTPGRLKRSLYGEERLLLVDKQLPLED